MSGFKQSENSFGRVPNSSTSSQSITTIAAHRMPEEVMSGLINVAVYLIAIFAIVELFLDCLGADKILEAMLRWRFTPSRENAYAIPLHSTPHRFKVLAQDTTS